VQNLKKSFSGADMELVEVIEEAFKGRVMPDVVTTSDCSDPADSDIEDTLWFVGRNWREVSWNDWNEHDVSLSFFTRDALAYWIPSVLLLSLGRTGEYLPSAGYLIRAFGARYWAPSPNHWTISFRERFVGLRSEEYEAIEAWLMFMSNMEIYRKYLNTKPRSGDVFERAIETVRLALRESLKVVSSRNELKTNI
jgi:hypothetical protein